MFIPIYIAWADTNVHYYFFLHFYKVLGIFIKKENLNQFYKINIEYVYTYAKFVEVTDIWLQMKYIFFIYLPTISFSFSMSLYLLPNFLLIYWCVHLSLIYL